MAGVDGDMSWMQDLEAVDEDYAVVNKVTAEIGAIVGGSNKTNTIEDDGMPYGGTLKVPVFLMTHEAHEPVEKDGVVYNFVVDDIKLAVEKAKAAGVVVVNGEVAELGDRVGGYGEFNYNWGATVLWFSHKDRILTGHQIQPGDTLVGLAEHGFRSNGITDVRKAMLEHYEPEWQDQTFRQWAGIIDPDTYMKGELAEGNEVQFISDENGYGVTSLVEKLTPNEFLLLRHEADTQDSGENEREKQWTGGTESYTLTDADGAAILSVVFGVPEELEEYFRINYPKALDRVKELAESS